MTRIYGAAAVITGALLFAVQGVGAQQTAVLVEGDKDTVMKVTYTGSNPGGPAPALSVTGEKAFGAIVEGTWRGVTGKVPGYAVPYPGLPAGVSGAGPIGIAAYGTGAGYLQIGAHIMSAGSSPSANRYGAEIHAIGGHHTYGVMLSAAGSQNVFGIIAGASGGENQNWAGYFEGSTFSTGTYEGSDRMFKKNIEKYSGGLAKVMALQPKSYDTKTDEFKKDMDLPKGRQIGLIAQEIQEVLPELVKDVQAPVRLTEDERKAGVQKEGLKFKAVNYTGLIPVLIAAIQEQDAKIEALKTEVAALKR